MDSLKDGGNSLQDPRKRFQCDEGGISVNGGGSQNSSAGDQEELRLAWEVGSHFFNEDNLIEVGLHSPSSSSSEAALGKSKSSRRSLSPEDRSFSAWVRFSSSPERGSLTGFLRGSTGSSARSSLIRGAAHVAASLFERFSSYLLRRMSPSVRSSQMPLSANTREILRELKSLETIAHPSRFFGQKEALVIETLKHKLKESKLYAYLLERQSSCEEQDLGDKIALLLAFEQWGEAVEREATQSLYEEEKGEFCLFDFDQMIGQQRQEPPSSIHLTQIREALGVVAKDLEAGGSGGESS